jgi:2-haloacid dehalogenase
MASDQGQHAVRACVFDAYGTLFDLGSAVRRQGNALGDEADAVALTWRSKQLEYAWAGSLRKSHTDFWTCTVEALDHALSFHGANPNLRDDLLQAYRTLDSYPDAVEALTYLRARGIQTAILSNGTPQMLEEACEVAGLDRLLDACLSIEEFGIYKPAPAAYALAGARLGLGPSSIGFVSSNPWDVAGALNFGFLPVWVNRDGQLDEYSLRSIVHEAATLAAAARCFASAPELGAIS